MEGRIEEDLTVEIASISTEDEVFQPVREIQVNTTLTDNQMKLDTNSIIPIWKKGTTEKEEIQNIRNYIRDIRRIQALRVVKNEPILINASLVKSGRTYLYEELPKEAEQSIDGFVAYLKTAYGLNQVDLLRELQEIRQGANENPYTYLSRTVNLFYEAKGLSKKTIAEAERSSEREEILSLFIRGIRSNQVRQALRCDLHTLNLNNLAMRTLNIQRAFEPEAKTDYSINATNEAEDEIVDDDEDEHTQEVNHITRDRRMPRQFSERKQYRDRSCFNCGSHNHINRFCPYDVICRICDQEGHYARDCNKGRMREPKENREE